MDATIGRTLASPRRRLLRVTANERLGAYRLLRVADPDGPTPDPGQFAMLAAAERWGGGERTSARTWPARSRSRACMTARRTICWRTSDPGTRRLCELGPGEGMWVLGPLGRGFAPPQEERRALLVGGGIGIAPLAILQDTLTADGVSNTVLLGFRDGPHAAGAALLSDAIVATDDGSVGHAGLVTDLLSAELDRDGDAVVYACGPAPMLEAVRALCAARGRPPSSRWRQAWRFGALRVSCRTRRSLCGFGPCRCLDGCDVVPIRVRADTCVVCVRTVPCSTRRHAPIMWTLTRERRHEPGRVLRHDAGASGDQRLGHVRRDRRPARVRRCTGAGVPVRRVRLEDDHAAPARGQPAAATVGGGGGAGSTRSGCPTAAWTAIWPRICRRSRSWLPVPLITNVMGSTAAEISELRAGVRRARGDRGDRAERVVPERAHGP